VIHDPAADPVPDSMPVSAPPRVRERLRGRRDGPVRVLHRGRHAVYVDLDGWCVGVVGAAAVAVPCALRLATDDLGVLTTDSAAVLGGVLRLDGVPLVIGRLVDVHVPALRHPPAPVLAPPVDTLVADIGRGPGLTPEADDELCGWLAVHRAAGVATPELDAAVLAHLAHTTLLSATLLECAVRGEVVPEFAAYVAALGTADEAVRAAELSVLGHTSGAALLRGARLALAHLHLEGTFAA